MDVLYEDAPWQPKEVTEQTAECRRWKHADCVDSLWLQLYTQAHTPPLHHLSPARF